MSTRRKPQPQKKAAPKVAPAPRLRKVSEDDPAPVEPLPNGCDGDGCEGASDRGPLLRVEGCPVCEELAPVEQPEQPDDAPEVEELAPVEQPEAVAL